MSDETNPGTPPQLPPPSFAPPPPPSPYGSTPPDAPGAGSYSVPLGPSPSSQPVLPPLASPPPGFSPDATGPYGGNVPVVAGPPKRSKGKLVGGIVAVTALLGGGAFALTKITGNDTKGGAASPEAVGTSLTTALANEDALGVVDLLLPGERATFRQPLIDLVDHLKRLEVVDGKASLGKVGGFSIDFANVEVTAEETNVADITNINVTGDSTVAIDGKDVPIGSLLIDEAFGGDRPDMSADPSDEAIDWHMTTVQRDGRWYLSMFYSAAESARGGADIPDEPIRLNGASSPDGAVDNMLQAISDLSLEDLLGTLNPNEAEALQRYAPLFLDDAQQQIDDQGIRWKINDTDYTTSGSGDRRSVSIANLHFEATLRGRDIVADYDGKCLVSTTDGTKNSTCGQDSSVDSAIDSLGIGDPKAVTTLVDTLRDAFKDYQGTAITTQKVNGKWYVSPIGSGFDLLLNVLQSLDKGELTDIIDAAKDVAKSLDLNQLVSSGGDVGLPDPSLDPLPTDSVPVDPVTGDTVSGDGSSASDAAIASCYSSASAADAVTCFQTGIESGVIDPTYLPVEYRFPECGATEQYWNGEVYSMSDADFISFVAKVAPCFQAKVADGTIEYWALETELWAPECLEGKNWYATTDPDYNNRVFECASQKQP